MAKEMRPLLPALGHLAPYIPKNYELADTMYERIVSAIEEFEKGLSPSEEVGARLAQFGQLVTIAIEDLSYHNPFLMKIHGRTAEGEACTLLQHMSQLNILLIAVKAKHDPPQRVGFRLRHKDREDPTGADTP